MRLAVVFFTYALLHVSIRLLAPGAVEHDEAEQLLLAQSLDLGYGKHPPLYTWLQYSAFQLLGVGVLGLTLLKHACLLGVYGGTYLAARRVQGNPRVATLTVLSLWLVPAVAWEAPRDLTHSVLAAALAPPTVQALVGLAERPSAWRYAALGGMLGLGFLAKYNFAFFAAVLLGAALTVPVFRSALLDRRTGLTVLMVAAVAGPHVAWLGANVPSPTWTTELGVGQSPGDDVVIGLARRFADVVVDVAAFLGPLVLVVAVLVPAVRRPAPDPARVAARPLLERYLLALVAILVLSVPLVGLARFRARWLLPLLVVSPLALFLRVPAIGISAGTARSLAGVCGAAGILALVLRLGGVWAGPSLGYPSRLHLPIAEVAVRIRATGFRQGTIIAGDIPLGGNLRLHFPHSLVLTPNLADVGVVPPSGSGQCLLVWRRHRPRRESAPPAPLLAVASARLGRPPPTPASSIILVEAPLRGLSAEPYELGLLAVAPGPPPCGQAVAPGGSGG